MKLVRTQKDGLFVTLRQGTNDEQVLTDVLYNPLYNLEDLLNWYYAKVIHNLTVVDIGAHIGIFALKVKAFFNHSHIYCFEPEDTSYFLLRENLKYEDFVYLYRNAVVGKKIKPISYYFWGTTNKPASTSYRYAKKGRCIVPYLSWNLIDSWFDYIDILKIDCEGGERWFIEDINWKKVKYFIGEIHLSYDGGKHRDWFLDWYEKWKKDTGAFIMYEKIGKHLHIRAKL